MSASIDHSIELRDMRFGYARKPLFADFSLAIRRQEFFGIVGPNGSGKTTLLRLMAGLLHPQSGLVMIQDRPLTDYSRRELARVVAFAPQENHFALDFSVEDVVLMGRNPFLHRFQQPGSHDIAQVRAALEFTDTVHLKDQNINRISGGERQRVVLARTLAQEPRILLLDEPTSHLDFAQQLRILEILRRLNRQGVTIVFLSHDLNLASVACSRVLLLDKGHPAACDTPDRVLVPDLVERVYGVRPLVNKHPETGAPQIVLPGPH